MTDKIKSEDFIKAFGSGGPEHHITTENNAAIPMEIVAGKCPIETDGNCPLRLQGEWIFRNGVTCGGYYKCSNCGEVERAEKKFCPNCGADMRNGEKK